MNKTTLLLIGGIIVVLLAVFAMRLFTNPATNTAGGSNLPQALERAFPSSNNITSTTSAAATDFLTSPETTKDPINAGVYYVGPHPYEGVSDPTATDAPPFVIEYHNNSKSFIISLKQEPLSQTRKQMEQLLMQQLNLSQDALCRLTYTVTVPYRTNQFYAGENLGFSFCPGSVQLP